MNKYSKFFPRYIAFPMAKVWNVSQSFAMFCIKFSKAIIYDTISINALKTR